MGLDPDTIASRVMAWAAVSTLALAMWKYFHDGQ